MTKSSTTTGSSGALEPVELHGDIAARTDAIMENTGGRLDLSLLPRITPPAANATVWSYSTPFGDETTRELDLVVLARLTTRALWSQPLGSGDVLPDCTSTDGRVGRLREGVVLDPAPSLRCETCWYSTWGSAPAKPGQDLEDVRAQACREFRVLPALVLPSLTVQLVRIPPTSGRAVDAYVQDLGLAGFRLSSVITRATLETTKSASGFDHALVKLQAVGKVDDPEQVKAIAELASAARGAMLGTVMADTTLAES